VGRRPGAEEDAIETLMALGERRPDAERLLDRARAANPALVATDALVREMLRLRTARS
jgi:Holliday junction resolvasome RuvABC DNA-binding subunit